MLDLISKIATIAIPIVGLVIAYMGYRMRAASVKLSEQSAYFSLYKLVENHHSESVTELRKAGYSIEAKCEEAIKLKKSLKEYDEEFHLKVSALANYYESVGMFLEFRWGKLPEDSRNMMLAMLHNSTSTFWPLFDKYKDCIYPNSRPSDWAHSFKWLFGKVNAYKQNNNFS